MSNWSQDFTVKSNARRAARKAGIDPSLVKAVVKAGETLYRFPTDPAPKAKPAREVAKPALKKARKTDPRQNPSARTAARAITQASRTNRTPAAGASRGGLKFIAVAELLRRPQGASITEVVAATGWKPHSARARISVDVSKLLAKGEEIVRRREAGVSHYAIVKSKQLELPVEEAA